MFTLTWVNNLHTIYTSFSINCLYHVNNILATYFSVSSVWEKPFRTVPSQPVRRPSLHPTTSCMETSVRCPWMDSIWSPSREHEIQRKNIFIFNLAYKTHLSVLYSLISLTSKTRQEFVIGSPSPSRQHTMWANKATVGALIYFETKQWAVGTPTIYQNPKQSKCSCILSPNIMFFFKMQDMLWMPFNTTEHKWTIIIQCVIWMMSDIMLLQLL